MRGTKSFALSTSSKDVSVFHRLTIALYIYAEGTVGNFEGFCGDSGELFDGALGRAGNGVAVVGPKKPEALMHEGSSLGLGNLLVGENHGDKPRRVTWGRRERESMFLPRSRWC